MTSTNSAGRRWDHVPLPDTAPGAQRLFAHDDDCAPRDVAIDEAGDKSPDRDEAPTSAASASPADPGVFDLTDFGDWPRVVLGGKRKRVFDFVAAAVMMVFLSPLLAISCLVIWLQDGGAPIYAHKRIGVGGRVFKCLKLRSMNRNGDAMLAAHLASNPVAREEWARSRKLSDDPRITGFGHFIRKTSIDELPQLLNVLRGEMSLVGPRPIVADELMRYDMDKVHYLRARPGLTGLWQVSGRSSTTYAYRISLDKSYVLKWSFLSDILIIVKTVPAVLLRRGAV